MTSPSIAERITHRTKDEIHDCVVPGCGLRAREAFHVDARLRLAGRDWTAGDFVDLCPDHGYEMREAALDASCMGYDDPSLTRQVQVFPGGPTASVLEWMDAEPNPLDRLREWKPPVCLPCGHRHVPVRACADHTWADSCPYYGTACREWRDHA